MSSLIEHAERVDAARTAEVARLNAIFNEELPCNSVLHDSRWDHSGPAGYWQIGTCSHTTGLRCASSVENYNPKCPMRCPICGDLAPYNAYRFIRI